MKKKLTLSLIAALLIVTSCFSLTGCTLFGRGDINEFADELFPQLFAYDALSANFFLEDPSAYGITPEASLYTPTSKEEWETNKTAMRSQAQLMAIMFKYSKMSDADKGLFAFLQDFFLAEAEMYDFYYLQDSYIGSYMGTQANLPIYLTEYKFRTVRDIDDYLKLCNDAESAFPKYVDYEKERINNGYGRATYVLVGAIRQCEAFTGVSILDPSVTNPEAEENFVLTNFKNKIGDEAVNFLTDTEKTEYINKATEAINNKLIPAYVKLGRDIRTLLTDNGVDVTVFYGEDDITYEQVTTVPNGSLFNNKGLAAYDGGKEYYEQLLKDATATNDSVSEAYVKLNNAFIAATEAYNAQLTKIQTENPELNIGNAIQNMYANEDWDDEAALYSTLNSLKASLGANFPAMAETEGEIILKQVDESLADNYSPAAFFVSALDNLNADEVIIINSTAGSTGYLSYDLLSHEGIPGHLYQYNYLKNSNVNNVVKVLCPTAYKEAWATYAQMYVTEYYKPNTLENDLYVLNNLNTLYNGYLRCMIDIWVNYEGYTVDQLATKLAELFGGTATDQLDYATRVYALSVEVPTNALTYYYGYLTLTEIKDALVAQGYSDLDFHKAYLDNPYSFTQIKEKFSID